MAQSQMAMMAVFVAATTAAIFAMVHSNAIGNFFGGSKPDLNNDLLSQYPSIIPVSYSDVVPRPTALAGVLYKPRYPNDVYSAEDTNPSPSIVGIPSRRFEFDPLLDDDEYDPTWMVFLNSTMNLLLYNPDGTSKFHRVSLINIPAIRPLAGLNAQNGDYPNGYPGEKVYKEKSVAMQSDVYPINVPSIVNSPTNAMMKRDLQSPSSQVNVMLNGKVPTHSSSKILKPIFLESPSSPVTYVLYN
eukprot:CAMPEP_0194400968 /NCGR_PEP_ID=MMETSP0174-20130528/127535_1 /TAXON_ID=216777 /ORGANISM="Proboscia alata, Strain PI-D3" /LENGTH=243 /DNA_ID=CAMNT_0039197599 /DNA_START=969 /DNA_END=1697 /DNA_ORIENTATION=-